MTWVDDKGITQKSRVFVTTIMTDTVARPQVMCLTQFNGLYGCAWCLQERDGESKWDYRRRRKQGAPRTNKDLRETLHNLFDEMGNAVSTEVGRNGQGIQGRTRFADLPYIDIIGGTTRNKFTH